MVPTLCFIKLLFPTTFMFGYPFLRPCEYKQGIVRKSIFRQASATRNSVIVIVIIIVPRFDQTIYVIIGQQECLLGQEECLVGQEECLVGQEQRTIVMVSDHQIMILYDQIASLDHQELDFHYENAEKHIKYVFFDDFEGNMSDFDEILSVFDENL